MDHEARSTQSSATKHSEESWCDNESGQIETRIYDPVQASLDDCEESRTVWGFRDTEFRVNSEDCVEVTGSRYALSGLKLPSLISWMENMLQLRIPLLPREKNISRCDAPKVNKAFADSLQNILGPHQISDDPDLRTRHGHGHSQAEIYSINYGRLRKVPDLVVYPESEIQVEGIVRAAVEHKVCLIPYGGGTNVSEALICPEDESRMIVSVDMKRLNRIQWIDPVNKLARIEAGATGRHISATLAKYGLTIGHEPDSVEFSTLGGWISTNASGMKKNKYGNIEDLVLDVNLITANGLLTRGENISPRESTGSDPTRHIFGSEGNLSIITSAIVKLFPIPARQVYGSILFPTFAQGLSFLYTLTQSGTPPASVRLVDNLQFQLSQVLKPPTTGILARVRSWLEKFYILRILRFSPTEMAACTLVFEGSAIEVRAQEISVYSLAARHGGVRAGAANGNRGYQMTFAIAYLRDFIMKHGIIAESFETSVAWSRAKGLCAGVKRRIEEEHAKRGLPGRPFVTGRISQVYGSGVTVYFYLAMYLGETEDPSRVFAEIERAAREEILDRGGSLSHHHGVGKLRKEFFGRARGEGAVRWNRAVKHALDPGNVFGVGNASIGGTRSVVAT